MTYPLPLRIDGQPYEDLSQVEKADVVTRAKVAYEILRLDRDLPHGLLEIERYVQGRHPGPYIPKTANEEYRILAKRSTSNFLTLVLDAPAQALFVEGHRLSGGTEASPAWACWQFNRLDGRQPSLYRSALSYGSAYVAVDKNEDGKAIALMLSPLHTTALYEDPVNDARPALVLSIQKWAINPTMPGKARMWDREKYYELKVTNTGDFEITFSKNHGFSDCPVIAFCPFRDLEGRPAGIIKQLFPIQDRINQTLFDTMVNQSFGSFQVRYASGLVPAPKTKAVGVTVAEAIANGDIAADDERIAGKASSDIIKYRLEIVRDADGNPVPEEITAKPNSFLVLKDPNAKVGSLPQADLSGYIESLSMSVHHLSAISQIPPHYLLGDLANLSADALAVAESSLWRMVAEFQHSFGESWEQVFQLFAEAEDLEGADDFNSEVRWRDTSAKSMAQQVDALGKAATMLGIPAQGLWDRFPGATDGDIRKWTEMHEDAIRNYINNPDEAMFNAVSPANLSVVDQVRKMEGNAGGSDSGFGGG